MGAAAGRVHRAGHYVFAHGIAGNGADCAEGLRAAMAAKTSSSLARMSLGDILGAQLPVDVAAGSTVVELGSLRDDVHVELEATATLVDAA